MLTAGRGYRRATAGAGRDAAPCSGAFPDAVTVSLAATSGGSCAVTPARGTSTSSTATPTASTLGQRGGYHQSTDCQAEHESA